MSNEILNQLNADFKASGGEYVGSMLWLRVSAKAVEAREIRNMILNDPRLDNSWAPDTLNNLTLYLQTMSELNRASLGKFEFDESKVPFTKDSHAGYSVHRLFLRKDSAIPTAHKILHLEKTLTEIKDATGTVVERRVEDVEADSGIRVECNRLSGGVEEDSAGTSEFQLKIDGVSDRYLPFIETLSKNFEAKRNEFYDSQQVRNLIVDDIIMDKMQALSVTRGVYFIEGSNAEAVEALREGLLKIHPGIRLSVHHVGKFAEGSMLNRTFEEVSVSVTDTLMNELEMLQDEMQGFIDSETKTRPSTWTKREQALREYRKRVKRVSSKLKLDTDILNDMLDDCTDLLDKGVRELK